jgi:hypothetical protein
MSQRVQARILNPGFPQPADDRLRDQFRLEEVAVRRREDEAVISIIRAESAAMLFLLLAVELSRRYC